MSVLTLIRHGQATLSDANYDQLSPLGELQARRLGEYWIRRGLVFDQVCSGTLVRQRRTAEIVGECYAGAGRAWPGIRILPEFNEYDFESVLRDFVPWLAARDARLQALVEELAASQGTEEAARSFQRLFETVMPVWMDGHCEAPCAEAWLPFRDRVLCGLRKIRDASGKGSRVAVFTSGGPIGVSIQAALAAPDPSFLQMCLRIRNCSVTEFLFTQDRLSLDSFNATPHLEDPSLITFR